MGTVPCPGVLRSILSPATYPTGVSGLVSDTVATSTADLRDGCGGDSHVFDVACCDVFGWVGVAGDVAL